MLSVKRPDQDLVRHDIAERLARKPDVDMEGRGSTLNDGSPSSTKSRSTAWLGAGQIVVGRLANICQCCAVDVTGGDDAHARVTSDDWRELAGRADFGDPCAIPAFNGG